MLFDDLVILRELEIDGKEVEKDTDNTDYTNNTEDTPEPEINDKDQDADDDTENEEPESKDTTDYTQEESEENEEETTGEENDDPGDDDLPPPGDEPSEETDDEDTDADDDTEKSNNPTDYTQEEPEEDEENADDKSEDDYNDGDDIDQDNDDDPTEYSGKSDEDKINDDYLKNKEKELFNYLTPAQLAIKNAELLRNYIDLYESIGIFLDNVYKIDKTHDNNSTINFIVDKLMDLKNIVGYSISTTYITRTYVENVTKYKQSILILQQIHEMLKGLIQKESKS